MYVRFMSMVVALFALQIPSAMAGIDNGLTRAVCLEVDVNFFQEEISATGSSCRLIGRQKNAAKRAEVLLDNEADNACDDVFDNSPVLYGHYCDLLCEVNGFEDALVGVYACDVEETDRRGWSDPNGGCFTGSRQYVRIDAEVACGCRCRVNTHPDW